MTKKNKTAREDLFMKYETIQDALATDEGKKLFLVLNQVFKTGLACTDSSVRNAMDAIPCYLGSEDFIGRMVWKALNTFN